jgi:hypothetical protein
MSPALVVHVTAGALGLLTGGIALGAGKGSALHRRSGRYFVYAMLVMGLTGAAIAAVLATAPEPKSGIRASMLMGLFAAYLVATALTVVSPPSRWTRRIDLIGMPLAAAIGVGQLTLGALAVSPPAGSRHVSMITVVELVFGTIALFAAASDARLLRSPVPLAGTKRIARHLWRMTFALWIAVVSFFPRLTRFLPGSLGALIAVPILGVLVVMFYWLWRVRYRKSFRGLIGVAVPR